MTNEEKAKQIALDKQSGKINGYLDTFLTAYESAIEMSEWKDKQIYLLLDSIDHAYLRTDETYGELSYEVSDKVKFLKKQLKSE